MLCGMLLTLAVFQKKIDIFIQFVGFVEKRKKDQEIISIDMRNYKTKKVLPESHRRKLLNLLASSHSHSEITQWANFIDCQSKFKEYKAEKAKMTIADRNDLEREVGRKALALFNKMKISLPDSIINPAELKI